MNARFRNEMISYLGLNNDFLSLIFYCILQNNLLKISINLK